MSLPPITQRRAKQLTAAALQEAKTRNGWSNGDAGDVLGVGEGTIRNRLDDGDSKHQMTVYELLRSIQVDGTHIANAILAGVRHHAEPNGCTNPVDAMTIAYDQTRCAAELIAAAAGGFTHAEAERLLPMIVDQNAAGTRLEARLRAILAHPP